MKKRYSKLQSKRFFIRFPVILTVIVLTLAVALLAASLALGSGEDKTKKLKVAATGDVDDDYLQLGIYAIQNFDSSRFSIDFATMSLPEAKEALKKREIHGYILFPPGFTNSIQRGENNPADYVISKNTINIGTALTGELTTTISELVVEVQRAVYSMRTIAKEEGIKKGLGSRARAMNEDIIKMFLARDDMYDTSIVGFKDNLSLGGYYVGALVVFFLSLWGLACCAILGNKSRDSQKLLKSRGIGIPTQIRCEFKPFFLSCMSIIFVGAISLGIFIGDSGFGISELEGAGILEFISFTIKIVPVVLMMCLLHFFIFEITDSMVGAVLFEIIMILAGGYISGCFYPNSFFPDTIISIADSLPLGAGFSYIRKCMSSSLGLKEFLLVLSYCAFLFVASCLGRKKRLESDSI
ncbi:MAG: ABC transporter permease [Ruminococcaceae bacterium]|nr:ABC transporter permease [Oscillospiraceae bacterium]